jgi:hypothetical protein
MGRRGYPLLLASGETADGATTLVNRQHPHDLIMEMSGSYSHPIGADSSVFIYAGLPGEPAFGPPAFMHRLSAGDSPAAPISHHWLDSTHIVAGVVTAGYVWRDWKLDASQFTGREPNQNRFDIDHPRFDSTSVRLSWNPTTRVALQVSWANLHSPEQLEPQQNQRRWSASAMYTAPVGRDGLWSSTIAWGRKELSDGPALDAVALETALKPDGRWTLFARGEIIRSNELIAGSSNGPVETAGEVTIGIIRDVRLSAHTKVGFGGLYTFDVIPGALRPSLGDSPRGAMALVRFKVE